MKKHLKVEIQVDDTRPHLCSGMCPHYHVLDNDDAAGRCSLFRVGLSPADETESPDLDKRDQQCIEAELEVG